MPNFADSAAPISALPLPLLDVAGSTATTETLTLGTSIYGTDESASDRDWYAVTLYAGHTYDFRVLGVGTNPVQDTYLTLRDATGKVLLSNNDANGDFALNSTIQFTNFTTGTFYVDAGGYGNNIGDFLVTAASNPGAGPVLSADEVAWQLTNNFARYFEGAGSNNI